MKPLSFLACVALLALSLVHVPVARAGEPSSSDAQPQIVLNNHRVAGFQPPGLDVGDLRAFADTEPAHVSFALTKDDDEADNALFFIEGSTLRNAVELDAPNTYRIRIRATGTWGDMEESLAIETMLPMPGDLDRSFDPGAGLLGATWSILPQPDGKILVAGTPPRLQQSTGGRIARLLLVFIAEASKDLLTWLPFDAVEEISDDGNGETETVTLIAAEPLIAQGKHFLRVRVER